MRLSCFNPPLANLHVEDSCGSATGPASRRVLMLTNSLPYPPTNGSKMRVWSLLSCLKAERCCIDLLCFGDMAQREAHRNELSCYCRHVEAISRRHASLSNARNLYARAAALLSRFPYGPATSRSTIMRTRLSRLLDASLYDLVLVEEADLLVNLPEHLTLPLIIDYQNAEHVLLERYANNAESWPRALYARVEGRKLRRWEAGTVRRATTALVCSDHDRAAFLKLAPQASILVVPNVIDASAYTPPEDDGHPNFTVLYAGAMDWYPNRDAVRYFARNILTRLQRFVPDVEFVVAGRAPSSEFVKEFADVGRMRFTGTLPDLRPEIERAAVCVVPLRIGSGTRMKILEAAALGKAIVSTGIGAEGLAFVNGTEILLADAPTDFADAVISLTDRNRRRRLGQAARERLEMTYGLPAMRAALQPLWSSLSPQ